MATFKESQRAPSSVIQFHQETLDQLKNNTLTFEFYELLKKAMREGYKIVFIGYGAGDDNEYEMTSEEHLKNYINNIQGLQIL